MKLNGKTAENFYKAKSSMDFVIEPGRYNSIIPNGAYNATVCDNDEYQTLSYRNPIFIGEYNGINQFQIENIDKRIKQIENAGLNKVFSYAALYGGMILTFWLAAKVDISRDNNAAQQNIENTDNFPVNDSTKKCKNIINY